LIVCGSLPARDYSRTSLLGFLHHSFRPFLPRYPLAPWQNQPLVVPICRFFRVMPVRTTFSGEYFHRSPQIARYWSGTRTLLISFVCFVPSSSLSLLFFDLLPCLQWPGPFGSLATQGPFDPLFSSPIGWDSVSGSMCPPFGFTVNLVLASRPFWICPTHPFPAPGHTAAS